MYQLHTEKQQKYFKEVIRLHYEEGYGENRIARIIPIGHTTAARWIAIFAREKGKIKGMADMAKTQEATSVQANGKDVKELQKKVKELEAQLLAAEVKAEVYDRMIEIAESRFGIPNGQKSIHISINQNNRVNLNQENTIVKNQIQNLVGLDK